MKTALNTSVLVTADSPKGQRATETFRAQYNKAGLDEDGGQRLNEHPGFAVYLADGIRRFSAKAPDYNLAQSILGVNFITPEEVAKARPSIVYTDDQIMALAGSLPSADVLKWCKDNDYAVVPAPPTAISMLGVREVKSANFYSKTGGWYADQKFAREDKTGNGWLMVKKTPVADSTSKSWDEQTPLLSGVERVPNAAEMSWFITTYFEVRGVRLFASIYVRTSSVDSDGDHVFVGDFGARGLGVVDWSDDGRDSDVGVSSARK